MSKVPFSVLPPPLALELVKVSLLPDPVPTELVEFSVLPQPVPEAVVRFAVLPAPLPTQMARLAVWPDPAPEAVVEHFRELPRLSGPTPVGVAEVPVESEPLPVGFAALPAPVAPAVDVSPESRSDVAAAAGPAVDGWQPPVAPIPQPARQHSPTRTRPIKPERAAPSGSRRLLVGFSAVVLGALSVVAVRTLVRGNDDDDVETAVPTPSAVVQTSVPVPDVAVVQTSVQVLDAPVPDVEVSPTTAESGVSATTVAAPTVSATAAPESATTAPAVPVSTNSTPASVSTRFSGVGNDVIDLRETDVSRKIMVVTHSGVASFELTTLDQDLNQLALVESVVGTVSGTYPLGFDEPATASYLRVDADGEWAIEIKPIDEARVWHADFIAGTGPDVVRFEGGASVLDYTNAGSSNFVVQYLRNPGFDLLVNEIGPISGATTMQTGPGVVIVDAEGDWALSAHPA